MSSRVSITFTMENDAFHNPEGSYGDEAQRIVADIARKIRTHTGGTIQDVNGNTIGKWSVR